MDNTVSVNNFPASPDGENGNVIQQPTTVPVPAPQYTQNGDAPNVAQMFPDDQGKPQLARQGMSPLQLGLRGALLGIAAGLSQRTAGQGAAAGANAGAQVSDQNQQDIANQNKAAQEQQQASDQHSLVMANLQLHNVQMMAAQQQVKNGTLDYYDKLANSTKVAQTASQDSDGFQVYGTAMPEDVVKQKYMEIHQQNPNARVTYGVDGATTDANGNVVPTFSLYDPGSGMVKLTPEKIQQLKDAGIQIPSNVPADAQVSTTALNQWRSQSVQNLATQKAKAETDAASANATTAQSNAKYADQKNQAAIDLQKSTITKNRADAAKDYAQAAAAKFKGADDPVYAYDPSQGRTIFTSRADAQDRGLQGLRKVTETNIRADAHDSAVLNDIALKSNNMRQAAVAMDDKSWTQAALVAKYLADNPNTTLQGLERSTVMKNLTPQARSYVIANYSLRESSMGLQKVLTGSARANETQINALMNTLPGVEPNSQIVNQKLDAFTQNLDTIRKSLPILPGIPEIASGTQQTATPQSHVFSVSAWQRANPNGDANAAKAAATQQGYQVVQ